MSPSTLLPSSEFGIKGYPGKPYEVGPICARPQCGERARQGHHLWPRSFLRGQPQDWVQLPDGTVIGNRVGLCVDHHNRVTGEIGGYRARITFRGGIFWWYDVLRRQPGEQTVWTQIGALAWQPPGVHALEVVPEKTDSERCSECGKPKHSKPHPPRAARKKKEWTLSVPDDAEIGDEILDGWADDLAEILGFADQSSRLRRYHAIATALAWTMQHRDEFVADLMEAARA